jgi:hypothetical protein
MEIEMTEDGKCVKLDRNQLSEIRQYEKYIHERKYDMELINSNPLNEAILKAHATIVRQCAEHCLKDKDKPDFDREAAYRNFLKLTNSVTRDTAKALENSFVPPCILLTENEKNDLLLNIV